MDLMEYAKAEMELAFPEKERDGMQQTACKDVLDLIQTFSDQGHSGMSGNYVLNLFNRLVRFKPISPLTGEDREWRALDKFGDHENEQNVRCSSVFRTKGDNSTARDIDGRVFSEDGGKTWYSSRKSVVPVSFPYYPLEKPEEVLVGGSGNDSD